jgi:hypothetical protein
MPEARTFSCCGRQDPINDNKGDADRARYGLRAPTQGVGRWLRGYGPSYIPGAKTFRGNHTRPGCRYVLSVVKYVLQQLFLIHEQVHRFERCLPSEDRQVRILPLQ